MTSSPAIDAYLDEVAAALLGAPRARRDVVAELRSGLLDAVDARCRAGLPMVAAAEAAIGEFGDPGHVAAAFGPELAVSHARNVALTLLATGPVIGLLWAAAALGSHFGIRLAPPWQWAGLTAGSHFAAHLATGAFLIAVLSALATVVESSRVTRWVTAGPRLTAATAAMASVAAAAADLAIVALLASQLISAPGSLDPFPVTLAAAASLIRVVLARRAARRCLGVRAALA